MTKKENEIGLNILMGQRLKECRENKGLKQYELANEISVTKQYLNAIERGRKPLTIEVAHSCGSVLHVRAEYLLCQDDYKTENEYIVKTKMRNTHGIDYRFLNSHTEFSFINPVFSNLNYDSDYVYFRYIGVYNYDEETDSITSGYIYKKIRKDYFNMIVQDLGDYIALKCGQIENVSRTMPEEELKRMNLKDRYYDDDGLGCSTVTIDSLVLSLYDEARLTATKTYQLPSIDSIVASSAEAQSFLATASQEEMKYFYSELKNALKRLK